MQDCEDYKSGLTDFLHVLDSERSPHPVQYSLVQSDQTFSLNLFLLYKVLGGGWQEELKTASFSSQNRYP